MYRLSMVALAGLVLVAAALLAATAAAGGVPPFGVFMTLCFLAFCCNGVLFGNLNALAMQSLGRVAGLGAAMVSSLSSLVAVLVRVVLGRFYDLTGFDLARGLLLVRKCVATGKQLSVRLDLAGPRSLKQQQQHIVATQK